MDDRILQPAVNAKPAKPGCKSCDRLTWFPNTGASSIIFIIFCFSNGNSSFRLPSQSETLPTENYIKTLAYNVSLFNNPLQFQISAR